MKRLVDLIIRYNGNELGSTYGTTEYAEGYNNALFDVITDIARDLNLELKITAGYNNNKKYRIISIAE